MSLARKHFTEFQERSGNVPDAELDDFWATLPPAKIDEMMGEWKGGDFPTGHRATGLLQKLGVQGYAGRLQHALERWALGDEQSVVGVVPDRSGRRR